MSVIRRGCGILARRLLSPVDTAAACSTSSRFAALSTASGEAPSQREQEIADTLKQRLPGASAVRVTDTSGGCGSMYRIDVVAEEFRGKNIVKQHQLVAKALEEEIALWHGFTLQTKAPA